MHGLCMVRVSFQRVLSQVPSCLEAYYQIPGTEQFYWEQPYVDILKGEAKHRLEKEDKELLKQTEEACGVPASKWDQIEWTSTVSRMTGI